MGRNVNLNPNDDCNGNRKCYVNGHVHMRASKARRRAPPTLLATFAQQWVLPLNRGGKALNGRVVLLLTGKQIPDHQGMAQVDAASPDDFCLFRTSRFWRAVKEGSPVANDRIPNTSCLVLGPARGT